MLKKILDWFFDSPRFTREERKEKMADLRDMWLEEGDPRGEVMAELYEREFGRQKRVDI